MEKPSVAVLGASGMLGSMVLDVLAREPSFKVIATTRDDQVATAWSRLYDAVSWRHLDVESASDKETAAAIDSARWVINCIGLIKPFIKDRTPAELERAVVVNALFPCRLATIAETQGAKVLQIATDCVYSGATGPYTEKSLHDPNDVYGMSKSLGEPASSAVRLLRCSIIGPEPSSFVSLLEWFCKQPPNAAVNGFTNHQWNGVTTLHFARLCRGIITQSIELPALHHVVPADDITKAEMLNAFANHFGREDVHIKPVAASTVIDRRLRTESDDINHTLWRCAGYASPPRVVEMIAELGAYTPKWRKAAS